MKKLKTNSISRLIKTAVFVFVLCNLQALDSFAQFTVASPNYPTPTPTYCSKYPTDMQTKCQKARQAFESAGRWIVGSATESQIDIWMDDLINKKIGTKATEYKYMAGFLLAQYNQNDYFNGAPEFLVQRMSEDCPGCIKDRMAAIENALLAVYGQDMKKPKEFYVYVSEQIKQKKANYTTLLHAQTDVLLKNEVYLHATIIHLAFSKALGRKAEENSELRRWKNPSEMRPFYIIVEWLREYLYSPKGEKDLRETVAHAIKMKTGKEPTQDRIDAVIKENRNKKLIYAEMIK